MRLPWQAQFVLLALIWGSSFLLIKVGLLALVPLQVSGLRIVSGAVFLLVLALATRTRWPRELSTYAHLAVTGFLLSALPWTLFALSETRISSALAGIGNAVTPVGTMVLSLLFLPSDRPTARKVVAVGIGLVGVVTIVQPWRASGRPDLLGFGMVLLASLSYGAGWVWNRRFVGHRDLGGFAQPALQLVMASVEMAVAYAVAYAIGQAPTPTALTGTAPQRAWAVAAVLVLGLVGSGLAIWLQYNIVRAAGPTIGTMVTYVIPVVAVALGVAFLGERLSWPQVVGAGLVIAAALVTQPWVRWPRHRASADSTQ